MTSCKIHGKVKAFIMLVKLPQLDLDQILKNLEYDIFLQMVERGGSNEGQKLLQCGVLSLQRPAMWCF